MKSILHPSFRYTPSFSTDLKKTFARVRRTHRQDTEKAGPPPVPAAANVASIVGKTANRR
jgi:hypothetical protein